MDSFTRLWILSLLAIGAVVWIALSLTVELREQALREP